MTPGPRTLAALAGASLLFAACGSASESGIEKLIEAQTGSDVDIDLEDGQIKIETPEGDIEFSTDEDGGFSIEVDGEELMDVDVDGDGEGSIEISGEDGDSSLQIDAGGGSLPDQWPAEIPTPDGLAIEAGSAFESGEQVAYTVTGQADEGFAEAYSDALADAGLPKTSSFESDGVNYFHQSSDWIVTVSGFPGEGVWEIVISVTNAP